MNKISVFGATGFIGSRFCEMYPESAHKIKREHVDSSNLKVLYLISTTHNYNHISKDVATNLFHLSRVLEGLDSNCTFNFISSWFVYGDAIRTYERAELRPKGNYSYTKKLAEDLVMFYCEREKIPYRIFRLANVFGVNDKYSRQKNALQYLINEMRHDRDIELYYGGEFYRNYIHVDDVCRILKEGMETLPENEIYNVGSDRSVLFGDLIWTAHALLNSKSKITSIEPSEFHKKVQVKDFHLETYKIRKHGIKLPKLVIGKVARMILDE